MKGAVGIFLAMEMTSRNCFDHLGFAWSALAGRALAGYKHGDNPGGTCGQILKGMNFALFDWTRSGNSSDFSCGSNCWIAGGGVDFIVIFSATRAISSMTFCL